MDILALKRIVRPVIISMGFSAIGSLFVFLLKHFFEPDFSKLEYSVIVFVITSLSVILLFPRVLKIPFGKVSVKEFLRKVGLNIPKRIWLFVWAGIIAAMFTLLGMNLGSVLTGKYIFDPSNITLSQAIFSLTPGIWEEVLYRGVIMIILLRFTKSLKKAFIIQVLLFGLAHIKGFNLLSLVDAFSVVIIATAFTYIAIKTRSLIPGIIFHYLHDTFLYVVQLPGGIYSGFLENAIFYASLWVSVVLCIFVIKKITERYNIVNEFNFYGFGSGIDIRKSIPDPLEKMAKKERSTRKILLINAIGFSAMLLASIEESNLFVIITISLYILANIILYISWERVKKRIDFLINIITSVISFISAYDLYIKGSKQVYIIWILIGFTYLILAFVQKYLRKKAYDSRKTT